MVTQYAVLSLAGNEWLLAMADQALALAFSESFDSANRLSLPGRVHRQDEREW